MNKKNITDAIINNDIEYIKKQNEYLLQHDVMTFAIKYNNRGVINYCLSKGAKYLSFYVLDAMRNKNMELAMFFIEKFENGEGLWSEYLLYAVKYNDVDFVKLCVEKGVKDYNSAMCFAIRKNNFKLIKYFIEKGADKFKRGYKYAKKFNIYKLRIFFAFCVKYKKRQFYKNITMLKTHPYLARYIKFKKTGRQTILKSPKCEKYLKKHIKKYIYL